MKSSEVGFWETRYTNGSIPWDIGQAAPAFIKYFNKQKTASSNICVLGCGLGHDAFFISEDLSCTVCCFDFSEYAINLCKRKKTQKSIINISFYTADFFELTKQKRWKNYFDYVIEHTSFCAIDPARRKEYVELVKYLLKSGGKLAGLFFIRPIECGGPPFGSSVEEIRSYFKKNFKEIGKLHYEECLHKGKLDGDEFFGVFEKK